jgi:Ca2+-binding EF-hand superfamily protein
MSKLLACAIVLSAIMAGNVYAGNHQGKAGMMFEKMDTNKDSKVSRAESMVHATQRFDKADADKDGYITREEMQTVKAKYQEMKKPNSDGSAKLPWAK